VGSIGTRKDGRVFIQWVDGAGVQRQETLPRLGKDGKPLTARGIAKEGRRRLAEYEGKALRQRRGLDPLPSESIDLPFSFLFDWWWEQKGKTLRSEMVRPFLLKHLRTTIWETPLRDVTAARVQRLLADKVEHLAPKSLNDLRSYVFNMFLVARKTGWPWEGRPNPIEEVERFKVVPKPKKILTTVEWEPVLAEVPPEWQGPVATGLYAVMREGEIFGLRKEEVDLAAGVIMVSRSWDAPRTKDGKAQPIPIADQLRPHLEKALREAPGPLVFPKPDGTMHSRKLRLNRMLRAAIARAGLLEGYEHRCRAPHCGWKELRPSPALPAECPKCREVMLWAKPIPRHVRFHDTRHSGGTAVVRSAGMAVAQKFLRHSDVRLTIHTYGHLDVEDVREGIARSFTGTSVKAGTAPGLQGAAQAPENVPPATSGTAPGEAQAPVPSNDSPDPPPRTRARTARSAASARTRCSSAA
jgi:integrase